MRWIFLLMSYASAQSSLTLNQYLDQVKTHSPAAVAAVRNIESYEFRQREAEAPLMAELYGQFGRADDKKPTAFPFMMGDETNVTRWRAGLRKQTSFGLGADLFFNAQRTVISGSQLPIPDYMESAATLQLTQSLWRNGFGESTRAQIAANEAQAETALLQARFDLKNLILNAQNTYWSLVSFNQVVKLQEENVERARRLRDYMTTRTHMRLFDDTDAMQTRASFETREMELQDSLDQRAVLIRQFNTLRGVDSDEVTSLDNLPAQAVSGDAMKTPAGSMTREDFSLLRSQARMSLAQAKYARSQIAPQLDLQASISTNGRDGVTTESYRQAQTDRYPTWAVGVNFSVPLDYWLVSDVKHGYRAASLAADSLTEEAGFNEKRAWTDLLKQRTEALGRYNRSKSIEQLQTDLVKRERARLMNGRATTFEAIKFEQDLALAQIQRVQSQLVLMKLHNAIKTFEAKK